MIERRLLTVSLFTTLANGQNKLVLREYTEHDFHQPHYGAIWHRLRFPADVVEYFNHSYVAESAFWGRIFLVNRQSRGKKLGEIIFF